MKRVLLITLGIVLLAAAGFVAYKSYLAKPKNGSNNSAQNQNKDNPPDTIRLIATGDFIPHDSVNQNAKTDSVYNYLPMMQNLKPFFDKADIKFCNQPTPAAGESLRVSGYPVFNAPTEFSRDMAKLGCNVINTGSNHTFDKGQSAIKNWLDYWDSEENILAVVGANRTKEEQQKIRYFENKGVKFAIVSYTTYTNKTPENDYGVTMFNKEAAGAQIAEAKQNADIVIVSMRWGNEFSSEATDFQTETAQFLADSGASIILGHGPHVLQPVNKLTASDGHEAIVWYSLGNFLNTQLQNESLFNCIAVIDIDIATKSFKNLACLPIYMHYEWTAEEKKAEDLLKRHSLGLFTLDNAAEPLSRSQNGTTIDAQRARITDLLNKFTSVKILRDNEY